MDFSRRGFLNLLGIAGIGMAVGERPALALFGSDEADRRELVVPDAHLTAGHHVVHPKVLIERVPDEERQAHIARGAYGVPVARIAKNREPVRPFLKRVGRFQVRPRLPDGSLITDGHAAFYTASNEIREKFAQFSLETLREVPSDVRSMVTLITIADAPIHARPVGVYGDDSYTTEGNTWQQVSHNPFEDRGFDVVAHFRQFAVVGAQRRELETFHTYSEQGEYPLQIPKDVEMGMLLKIDREVVAEGANTPDRVAGILARFTRAWGLRSA